jgi:threonine dehydrogenase-like Zn-dependent dehydrogenase
VRFIAGKGPADLLTLRATRALGAADVLVLDGDADPEIVKMARRDVERLDPAKADAEHLVAAGPRGPPDRPADHPRRRPGPDPRPDAGRGGGRGAAPA